MSSTPPQNESRWRALWRRREPVLWALVVALVLTAQWPMLKGWYYKATGLEAPASGIAWRTDLDAALAEAKVSGRLVLVDFSATWCPPCLAMKHEVWPDGEVTQAVTRGFIPVVVDVDLNTAASDRYEVPGIPALLLLDGDGRIVRRHDGYLPKAGVLQFLAR
jgi:thiol:disulfide interchange protein